MRSVVFQAWIKWPEQWPDRRDEVRRLDGPEATLAGVEHLLRCVAKQNPLNATSTDRAQRDKSPLSELRVGQPPARAFPRTNAANLTRNGVQGLHKPVEAMLDRFVDLAPERTSHWNPGDDVFGQI